MINEEDIVEKDAPKESKLSSRKFLFSIGVFLVSTFALVSGYIPAEVWGTVATGVVWAYLTGNVAEKTFKNRF